MKFGAIVKSSGVKDAFSVTARQLPHVAARVLSSLAEDAKATLIKTMPEVFDRPTKYTLDSASVKYAQPGKLESVVFVKNSEDEQGKGVHEYLRPGAIGSSGRRQKRTEALLTRSGALPAGWVTTPGKGAQINAHGNLAGAVYAQIINVLELRTTRPKPASQRSRQDAKKLGVSKLFFVVSPGANRLAKNGGWLPPGVWKHMPGGRITQILKFVRTAKYKKRLDFEVVSLQAVNANLLTRWNQAVEANNVRVVWTKR